MIKVEFSHWVFSTKIWPSGSFWLNTICSLNWKLLDLSSRQKQFSVPLFIYPWLFVHFFIRLYFYLFYSSVHHLFVCSSICLAKWLSIHLSICLSGCPCVLSLYLPIYLLAKLLRETLLKVSEKFSLYIYSFILFSS